MVVSLYTSRVILQTLGVEDYGIYQSVGGIVGLISFLNGALATGTSRFITYSLGKNDEKDLRIFFSTALMVHVALAVLIILLAETVGLWFLYHKLIIPPERMSAAVFCYHLSMLSVFLSVTQVPYNALIIGHERMNIYAYVSIIEVVLKLLIVYALYLSSFDKLKVYATLFLLLSAGILIFYRLYCIHHFKEARYHFVFDKKCIKEIGAFSGWSLFTNGALALNGHGILILLNMFFSPAIVASRAISLQVNGAVGQFVGNFRTAVNPQITKRWAAGDEQGSKILVLESAKFCYYLVLVFAIPIIFTTETLLQLWLGQVPEYSVRFLQLVLIETLIKVVDSSLYQALYARGRIRENALLSTIILILCFTGTYVFLHLGYSPLAASYWAIVKAISLAMIEKPYILVKIAQYNWRDFVRLYLPCLWVTLCAIPLPMLYYLKVYQMQSPNNVWAFFAMASISLTTTVCSIWFFGLTKEMKKKLVNLVKARYKNN